jgi:hypothetical protein
MLAYLFAGIQSVLQALLYDMNLLLHYYYRTHELVTPPWDSTRFTTATYHGVKPTHFIQIPHKYKHHQNLWTMAV